jgi:vitamin B12/bleomycin/antimicrobial peptide transport system ATP-binding/permease protein
MPSEPPSRPAVVRPAAFDRGFARRLWRLTRIYWASPDAKRGGLLLGLAVALELAAVLAQVLLSDSQRQIFDALQLMDATGFFAAIGVFLVIVLGFVATSAFRIYVRQIVEIRWRENLTAYFLGAWIGPNAYCQEKLHHNETDNPDQRIAEDVREYVASALGLSLSLLSAVVTLVSFGGLLWSLSGEWAVSIGGFELRIPGLMLWVAILYAVCATWLTHRVGRVLVPINFDRQRVEADFRFGLVRFRENVEPVAFAKGEDWVRQSALGHFGRIVENWWRLIRAQRNLTLLTTGTGEVNGVIPLLVAAPAYFAGQLTLGGVTQTRIAYGQVSGALSWAVAAYQEIARWRASIERLSSFIDVMERTTEEVRSADRIRLERSPDPDLELDRVRIDLPDGKPLVSLSATVQPGERVALLGPLGTGKTALLRAIAGLWPFGAGRIELPEDARVFFLPARPFLPIGTLREAVSFPSPPGSFSDEKIEETLRLVGLGYLSDRLGETGHWEQILSTGEEQRIGIARTFLHEPDWILLDDATAGLDPQSERRVYELLKERLPKASLISLAHRPELARFHERHWTLSPGAAGQPATLMA